MVSVWATKNHISVGQNVVDEKSNWDQLGHSLGTALAHFPSKELLARSASEWIFAPDMAQ